MTMEIVNGIPCFNCTDVEKAKKVGTNGPADAQDPLHPSTKIGALKADSVPGLDPASSDQFGINQPLASGDRGTKINIAT